MIQVIHLVVAEANQDVNEQVRFYHEDRIKGEYELAEFTTRVQSCEFIHDTTAAIPI